MKKKLLAMTLASAMCVSMLAGCGGGSSTDTPSNGGSSAEGGSGESYNISVIVKLTDSHFNKVMAGARAYADEHDNVNVDIQSPTAATSYDEQVNMIETAVGNPSTNAIVVAPLQSDSASTLIANTDKVVIALDTDFASEKKSAFVGTGNQSAIQAVKDGSLAMDVAQNGYDMGYRAVEAAVKCLQGETVDAFIDSGVQVVDSSNVDSYIDDQTAKGLWE